MPRFFRESFIFAIVMFIVAIITPQGEAQENDLLAFFPRPNAAANATSVTSPARLSQPLTDNQPRGVVTLAEGEDIRRLFGKTSGIVVVDFYADWCAPCKEQSAIIKSIEPMASRSKSVVVKVDVDKHPDLATHFDVESLPTVIAVKDNQVIGRKTGIATAQELAALLVN